jgi:hypothetical protein
MRLHARLSEIEKRINRDFDLTVCKVYGGVSFGGTIAAVFGGRALPIGKGEDLQDFIYRAEAAAISAKQNFVAIMGL